MQTYRSKRGVKDHSILEEHAQMRTQWNMDMAERVLDCLFPEISLDDGNSVVDYTKCGKQPSYTYDTLAAKAVEYFKDIYDKNSHGIPIIPDIEDFCMFCGMSRRYYYDLINGSEIRLANLCQEINTALATCKKQLAFDGHINPTIFAIDMNNNHDYVQAKQQIEMRTSNLNIEAKESIDDISLRIPMSEQEISESTNIYSSYNYYYTNKLGKAHQFQGIFSGNNPYEKLIRIGRERSLA